MISNIDILFENLKKSKFRSSFRFKEKDKLYIMEKGMDKIKEHAYDFIKKRLSAVYPKNDGKQTPMRGHPVFIAEHATATCCRGCLYKWHKIPRGRELNDDEIDYIVSVIMKWIENQMKG